MNEEQKARLVELKAIAAADLTEAQKSELALFTLIEKQDKQITDQESFIGTKATELGTLKAALAAAKPEEKEVLQRSIDDKQAVIDTLTEALEIAKTANEELAKISPVNPGHEDTVDQKTVDALEDKLFAAEGGKEAMEAAVTSMTDVEYAKFDSDPSFRKKMISAALASVGSEETERSAWRKKDGNEETPLKDEEARMKELFGKEQRHHRFVPGGGGGRAPRRDLSGQKESERQVDERTS